ncbi:probable RNA-binding protein ARP1 isoform X4 [Capsicum annuum]|uniref:probable RNA-binding protein ARP1 isoform X4 n=1 Tax=Capsicum annuum TaxID=4072 RepID=UPI001FB10D0D|nr:probable RNA-binding protein ARP1 isoform X4 [Capsicum annuum]
MTMSNINQHHTINMGDTTLTKVFVGGLAWETPKEAMREHFDKYGDILEAVIISDKLTGRSKGYGFVTFKDAESAKKACEDATPIINGRRANCNLASHGARRSRPSPSITPPPPQQGPNVVGPRAYSASPASHVQWYYPARAPQAAAPAPASPFHHQHHHQSLPFYGVPRSGNDGWQHIDANVPVLSLSSSVPDNGPSSPYVLSNSCWPNCCSPGPYVKAHNSSSYCSLFGCGVGTIMTKRMVAKSN